MGSTIIKSIFIICPIKINKSTQCRSYTHINEEVSIYNILNVTNTHTQTMRHRTGLKSNPTHAHIHETPAHTHEILMNTY